MSVIARFKCRSELIYHRSAFLPRFSPCLCSSLLELSRRRLSRARLLRLLRLLLLRLRLLLLLLRLLLLHSSTLFVADDGCRDPRLPGRKLPP